MVRGSPTSAAQPCALGVVEASDAGLRLAPAFLQLTAADAPQTLANTLATQEARIRALAGCSAAKESLGGMSADDVLTVALGICGLPSSPAALASFANVDTAMPEVRTRWSGERSIWSEVAARDGTCCISPSSTRRSPSSGLT